MGSGRKIVSPQRIQQVLIAGKGHLRVDLPFLLGKGVAGERATQLVHHARLHFFQRNFSQGRQPARQIRVDHHLARRHAQREPAQDVAPIGHSRIGHRTDNYPFVFRRDRKEAVDELLGLGRIRSDRAGNKAKIDAGVLRLLEALRVEEHAHRRGNMGVIRLGPVIIDPLLDDAERSARIDLRRFLRIGRLDQHDRGGNESCVTHVVLLAGAGAANAGNANASNSI